MLYVCVPVCLYHILKDRVFSTSYVAAMHIHYPDMHIKYWVYVRYMLNLVGIFVSGTYSIITCEVEVAVGCVLVYICKKCWAYMSI